MMTQILNVPEGKIAYDSAGSGPLIVAVPGMGDLRQSYRFLAPRLVEAGYRVVTMDVRGHGESSAGWPDYTVAGVGQDILALARALEAGPAILIGNSMAAGAAVWAAVEEPGLVQAMVLLGPAVRGEVSGAFHLLISALFARPWGPAAWIAYFKRLFPTHKPADFAAYTAALRENLSAPGRMEALQKMLVASKQVSETRLSRVRAPVLVLMGTKDPDFKDPAAEAGWVAAQIGRFSSPLSAPFEMIAGAGHYPHVEMPDITAARILPFLRTLPLEAHHAEINPNQACA